MTAKVCVLVPVKVDKTVLVSTTATEKDPLYAAGTTFKKGDRCVSAVTNRTYESQKDANQGNDPTNVANRTGEPPWWLDIGPSNAFAMFDTDVSTATVAPSPLTVVLRPGFFKDIFVGGLDADEIDVTVRSAPGGEVIRSTYTVLEGSQPGDYDEFFFGRFKPQIDHIEQDIDSYNSAEITLTLRKTTGNVQVAVMDVGDLVELGSTLSGAKVEPKTFSYIEQDKYGGAKITRRGAANNLAISGVLDRSEAGAVHRTLTSVLDMPCLVIGSARVDYSPLRCYGLVSGGIEYPNVPDKCFLNINVQGLIKWQ